MKVDYNKQSEAIQFHVNGISGEKNDIISTQNAEKAAMNGNASSYTFDQIGENGFRHSWSETDAENADEITEISRKCSMDSGISSRRNSFYSNGDGTISNGKVMRCNKTDASWNKLKKAKGKDESMPFTAEMGIKVADGLLVVNETSQYRNGKSPEMKTDVENSVRKFESLSLKGCNDSSVEIKSNEHDTKIQNKGDEMDVKLHNGRTPDSGDSVCSGDWESINHDDFDVIRPRNEEEEKPVEKGLLQRLFSTTSSSSSSRSRKDSLSSLASFTSTNNNSLMYVSGVRYNPECMEMCKTERFVVRDSLHLGFDASAPLTTLDALTGHVVLEYMEAHVTNPSRLDEEWEELCMYKPEGPGYVTDIASEPLNARKNRSNLALPYDNNRVILDKEANVANSDYIHASYITDHDPRSSCYIVTQGPLPHTVADFWQMVWEQECSTIINLTSLVENDVTMCFQYWPYEGCDLYHVYEVHLVSEHVHRYGYIDSDNENENDNRNDNENDNESDNLSVMIDDEDVECVVRSFFVRNIRTGASRTVTQFHYLGWSEHQSPGSTTSLLHFRRKVKKSLTGTNSPVVVHCSDGAGRTGTYCLLDIVLSRLSKGVREIDISATLEHLRDQHASMVETKEQFEFVLHAMAEEVENSLNVTRI